MTSELAHGIAGTREQNFVRLLPPRNSTFDDESLIAVANQMDIPDVPKDGPDPEENLYVPAGYTYLGQFVDHDLTFDTTSTLNPDDSALPTNLRTPTLDLDNVYGSGPADQPYMYDDDGATLRFGKTVDNPTKDDVLRVPAVHDTNGHLIAEGRAIIGDKRNDENSIVVQIQLAMIKFHNKVVATLKQNGVSGDALFASARNEVRWTYQRMLVEDYLRRIVEATVYDAFVSDWEERGDGAYILYTPELRTNIPLEFAGAAYRFGHSMVRVGYRLNEQTALPIFLPAGESVSSLTGFQPLPGAHVIDDWGRFFPVTSRPELEPGKHPPKNVGTSPALATDQKNTFVRLQFAYKIDLNLTGPLDDLPARISGFDDGPASGIKGQAMPALSLLNLRRGNKFALPSGQTVAKALGVESQTVTRAGLKVRSAAQGDGMWMFVDMASFLDQTPLWLFVLAEAQRKIVDKWADPGGNNGKDVAEIAFFSEGEGALTQLGPVGGRLVLETLFGVLDADPRSFRNAAPSTWKPLVLANTNDALTFSHILTWTGLTLTDGFGK
ncbi:peroxidase family protein [Burkholderia sp. S171]|uniref:peroxidase family protein n=1 Tax=Burkholderia sp. S171 TaxID=1641860 RepID=UPI00131AF9B5|nr:peroxidase family protein [Burkholderia sp. S171]